MTDATDPEEPFDYERIPAGYYDHVYRRRKGMQSKWHHLKFRRVARELDGCHRVLDVGCGPGTLAGNFPQHEWVGADVSTRQVAHARTTYGSQGARFYNRSPSDLPDDERDFDAVSMVELIEHLDPLLLANTLDDALDRVMPGGKVVLTTPNFHSPWPLIEAVLNRVSDVSYDFQHINKFTRFRLRALLEAHGLERVTVEPYLCLAPFAASISWGLADWVAAKEHALESRLGLLLIGTGHRPRYYERRS
jgi:SAM-dependent methyltransferase